MTRYTTVMVSTARVRRHPHCSSAMGTRHNPLLRLSYLQVMFVCMSCVAHTHTHVCGFCVREAMDFWSTSTVLEALPGRNMGELLFDSRELPYYLSTRDEACRQGLQTNAVFEEMRVEVHQVPNDDL